MLFDHPMFTSLKEFTAEDLYRLILTERELPVYVGELYRRNLFPWKHLLEPCLVANHVEKNTAILELMIHVEEELRLIQIAKQSLLDHLRRPRLVAEIEHLMDMLNAPHTYKEYLRPEHYRKLGEGDLIDWENHDLEEFLDCLRKIRL
jgi:hypothetical protein